jgi:ssDNA-binding Zn-finger/Zn-ribbon topoisomerase 1
VEVLDTFYGPLAAAVERAQDMAATRPVIVPQDGRAAPAPTDETCPECGGPVIVREEKYGRFRACANFPRCKWSAPLVVGTCPRCGGELVERKGKRGVFWGCSRYPECRYTQEPGQGTAGEKENEENRETEGARGGF